MYVEKCDKSFLQIILIFHWVTLIKNRMDFRLKTFMLRRLYVCIYLLVYKYLKSFLHIFYECGFSHKNVIFCVALYDWLFIFSAKGVKKKILQFWRWYYNFRCVPYPIMRNKESWIANLLEKLQVFHILIEWSSKAKHLTNSTLYYLLN